MTQEAQGPSTRNLIDTSLGPLRRFTGILDSLPREPVTYGANTAEARTSIQISVNIKDIDVTEAVEIYHFPIYTIKINESRNKNSRWGVFGSSFNEVVDRQYTPAQLDSTNKEYVAAGKRPDISAAIGKRIGLVLADGEEGRPKPPMLFDGRSRQTVPIPAWTVFSVDGLGVGESKSSLDVAMKLLDGMTLAQFNTEALKEPSIRADVPLLQSISKPVAAPDSFSNTMLTSALFSKDEHGVFHRVK